MNHPFLGTLPVAFGSPSEYLERPGRAVTADFLRKVLKLGLLRLEDLCDRIDFEPLDKQSILTQVNPPGKPPLPTAAGLIEEFQEANKFPCPKGVVLKIANETMLIPSWICTTPEPTSLILKSKRTPDDYTKPF